MSECADCDRLHAELEQAWTIIAEFQRRLLIISNAVRGTERVLNRKPALGRAENVVADGTRGPGHSFPEPTVRFEGQTSEGVRALSVALEYGLPVFRLRRTWGVIDGMIHGPWWEMTFLPPRPVGSSY